MIPADIYQTIAELCAIDPGEAEALGAMLLALPPDRHLQPLRRSTLNNDGSPFQLCMTASSHGSATRLIADPCAFAASGPGRIERVSADVLRFGAALGYPSFGPLAKHLLEGIVPRDCVPAAASDAGIHWLAMGVHERGAAAYINARWDSPMADWARAKACLRSLLPESGDYAEIVAALETKTRLASAGIETAPSGDLRIKLYWRLAAPMLLTTVAVPLLHHPALCGFLAKVVSARPVPLSGLVFSTGFLLSTGRLEDVKVDICAHCLPRPQCDWMDLIDDLTEQHQLPHIAARQCMRRAHLEPAFLGLGINHKHHERLNLYLKVAHA